MTKKQKISVSTEIKDRDVGDHIHSSPCGRDSVGLRHVTSRYPSTIITWVVEELYVQSLDNQGHDFHRREASSLQGKG
jgi:hypothetical protein